MIPSGFAQSPNQNKKDRSFKNIKFNVTDSTMIRIVSILIREMMQKRKSLLNQIKALGFEI